MIIFLIAFISGMMFAFAGIGYKLTAMGKGNVMQSTAALSLCGTVFFGLLACRYGGWTDTSLKLALIAAGAGVCQYIGMIAFRKAMNSGPLSLVWCATSLEFMPAVIFAALCFPEKEPFSVLCFAALILVCAAIVSASFGGSSEKKEDAAVSAKDKVIFGLLLVILMVCFSSVMIGLKYGEYTGMFTDGSKYSFYSILYGVLLVFCAGDMIYFRTWTSNWKCWTGMSLNSVGTLAAFGLQLLLLAEPATITFALPNTVSILLAALISTLFMHEKRTPSFYATLIFSITAIILMALSRLS